MQACPPSRAYRLRKFARRQQGGLYHHRPGRLALVAGTAVATWQAIRATRAEDVAIAERDAKEAARREALVNAEQARAQQKAKLNMRKLAEAAARAERQAREAEAQQRQKAEAAEKRRLKKR